MRSFLNEGLLAIAMVDAIKRQYICQSYNKYSQFSDVQRHLWAISGIHSYRLSMHLNGFNLVATVVYSS